MKEEILHTTDKREIKGNVRDATINNYMPTNCTTKEMNS